MSETTYSPGAPYFSSDPYAGDTLTPQQVRDATFPSVRLGRRGVDETEVRKFCEQVADELTRSLTQRTALEAEVRRLRERVLGARGPESEPGPDGADPATGPSAVPDAAQVQAVNVLTMAQRTADRYVADAQSYSRELAADAHLRHEEILREAQVRASVILDEAHASAQAAYGTAGSAAADGTEAELAYLRTFSQVCRTHLRAYLESLSKSIEEWEKAEAHGLASARAAHATREADAVRQARAVRQPGPDGLGDRL